MSSGRRMGKTIWYDWHYPYAETFFVAGYNVETHAKTAYHLLRNGLVDSLQRVGRWEAVCGGRRGPGAVGGSAGWGVDRDVPAGAITAEGELNEPGFWQPGVFHTETPGEYEVAQLSDGARMCASPPDDSMVIFSSNMFGPS